MQDYQKLSKAIESYLKLSKSRKNYIFLAPGLSFLAPGRALDLVAPQDPSYPRTVANSYIARFQRDSKGNEEKPIRKFVKIRLWIPSVS